VTNLSVTTSATSTSHCASSCESASEYLNEIKEHISESRLLLAADDEQGFASYSTTSATPMCSPMSCSPRNVNKAATGGNDAWPPLPGAGHCAHDRSLLAVLVVIALIYSNLYRPLSQAPRWRRVLAPNGSPAQTVPDGAQLDNGAPTVYKEPIAKFFTVKVIASLYNEAHIRSSSIRWDHPLHSRSLTRACALTH